MAKLWSDPSLSTDTIETTDLLAILRASTDSSGNTVYSPLNITADKFSTAMFARALDTLGPLLPTTQPDGGGWWLNAGVLTYTNTSTTESGATLTTEAMLASYAAWVARLPDSDPGTGTGTFWNNNGVATESVSAS